MTASLVSADDAVAVSDDAAAPARSRRNVFVLTGAQAFAASGPPVIVSLGGIIGQAIAPDKALATLPVSLFTVGVALGTIPVAMLVGRIGRRPTYALGGVIGVAGGLLAAFAVFSGSFWLFCLATLLVGLNGACVMSYRFAAVELAGGMSRGRWRGAAHHPRGGPRDPRRARRSAFGRGHPRHARRRAADRAAARHGAFPAAFGADRGQVGRGHRLLPLRPPAEPQRGRQRAVAMVDAGRQLPRHRP